MFWKKQELIDLVTDSERSLADVLRRTKLLAARLPSPEFSAWVDNELKGYGPGSDVPEYRNVASPPVGTFASSVRLTKNLVLPLSVLPEEIRAEARFVPLTHGVRELEDMASKDSLRHTWPAEIVMSVRDLYPMADGSVLIEVNQPISQSALHGVLDAIRNRLLDFLLELSKTDPDLLESGNPSATIAPEQISQIFNFTIRGDHNVVAGGHTVSQTVSGIEPGDLDQLLAYLRSLQLPEETLGELREAIQADPRPAESGRFGPRVAEWMGNTVKQVAAGAWNVAVQTAPSLITNALSKYYGWTA